MTPGLTKSYIAGAAIAKHRIVKFDAVDGTVIQSAAATDFSIGVSEGIAAAAGEIVDVIQGDIAYVEMSGVVARGGPVTSDALGRGVAAAPAGGVNNRVIGFALVTTAAGDIAPVRISPHTMQG